MKMALGENPKVNYGRRNMAPKIEDDECCHYEGTTLPSEGIL